MANDGKLFYFWIMIISLKYFAKYSFFPTISSDETYLERSIQLHVSIISNGIPADDNL